MDTNTMCIIILILACVSILVYLLYRIKKDGLRATVIDLIVYAEAELGSGKGKEKMDYVIDQLVKHIPAPFCLFITTSSIKRFAQEVFDQVKRCLDYRPVDKQENNVIYNK